MFLAVIATDRRDALTRNLTLFYQRRLQAEERLAVQIKMRVGSLPLKLLCYNWHQTSPDIFSHDQRTMRCTEDA